MSGKRLGRAVELVLALAGHAGEGVDRTEEEVARDVLEVAAVLQPRSGHRDVVGGALALGLHQDRQVEVVLAVPRGERLEQLEAVRGGGDLRPRPPQPSAGGATKRVLAGVEARARAAPRRRARARRTCSPASLVSVSVSGSKSSVPASARATTVSGEVDEGQGVGRAVVALREVAVVAGDDGVGVAVVHVRSAPTGRCTARRRWPAPWRRAASKVGRAGRRARWWRAPARSRG